MSLAVNRGHIGQHATTTEYSPQPFDVGFLCLLNANKARANDTPRFQHRRRTEAHDPTSHHEQSKSMRPRRTKLNQSYTAGLATRTQWFQRGRTKAAFAPDCSNGLECIVSHPAHHMAERVYCAAFCRRMTIANDRRERWAHASPDVRAAMISSLAQRFCKPANMVALQFDLYSGMRPR